ncbi:glycosyltransferase involved in cell wall biosynthesis [Chryseobacterium shigense]|uniref:Glycosyltransferase involved in cell wall biosynthesis n=2 Tax=Chryseobacterium shigense TaxID=297244 RepID=A0A841NG61_9FLAO|nr:glycosyltransferase involved in cell wall biosynthesis [Chryseobacterium shigense]
MKKKVYFLLPGLTFGGAERIIFTLLNHLDEDKYEFTLLLFKNVDFPTLELKKNIKVRELGIERIRFSVLKILPIIHKEKPDIFFSGWGEISAFMSPFIPFLKSTKFISRETNVVSEHVSRKEIKFFYNFYNNYHRIIAQSDDMRKDLIDNFNIKDEIITKINNPVDFDFIDGKLNISVKPESFKYNYKNVVAIGNLSARKGFDNLLKVFSRLKNENVLLHILGDGQDKEVLLQMKDFLGLKNVIFHGKQDNPYQFLKYADLFILSSRYEGFPNVLLEAGACGTYSLANNCPGGINEIIQHQVNGEISDIENYEEFSLKIMKVLQGNYDRDGIRNSIRSRFSKDIILDKYEKVLLDLMK